MILEKARHRRAFFMEQAASSCLAGKKRNETGKTCLVSLVREAGLEPARP
nr:hypothetical protein [uncultured Dysosmobacter sp.]